MAAFIYHQIQTKRLDRLTVSVVLESPAGQWWLGRIDRQQHAIYLFSGPFGYHFSYHDADASHPTGWIHVKLDRNSGGRFLLYPGGKDMGIEAGAWAVPAFRDIRGVLPLPPSSGMGFMNPTALAGGRQAPTKWADSIVKLEVLQGRFIGCDFLCVEPRNTAALEAWVDGQLVVPGTTMHSVDVFTNFQP